MTPVKDNRSKKKIHFNTTPGWIAANTFTQFITQSLTKSRAAADLSNLLKVSEVEMKGHVTL
jgi:hypothetical protein